MSQSLSRTQVEYGTLSVAFSPDGKLLGIGDWNGIIQLRNLSDSSSDRSFQGHKGKVYAVAFSPDGKLIASGGEGRTVRLWDLNGKSIGQPFQGHEETIDSIAFSPDGNMIVSASWDGSVRLWDLFGNPIIEPLQGHEGGVQSVAFSPDGRLIASGGKDGTIRLWRGGWQTWLEVCCNRLRHHPIFKDPQTDIEKAACRTCENYIFNPEIGADKLYMQAIEEFGRKNFKAAVAIFSRAVQFNPKHSDAYYHRGLAYIELGDAWLAERDLQRATDLYREKGEAEKHENALSPLN